jgi:hypothetical protein
MFSFIGRFLLETYRGALRFFTMVFTVSMILMAADCIMAGQGGNLVIMDIIEGAAEKTVEVLGFGIKLIVGG